MNLWLAWNPSNPGAAHLTDDVGPRSADQDPLILLPTRSPGYVALTGLVTPFCEIARRAFERIEPVGAPTAPLVSCIACVRAARIGAQALTAKIPGGLEL